MKGYMKLKQLLAYLYALALVLLLSTLAFSQSSSSVNQQYLVFSISKPELKIEMPGLAEKIKDQSNPKKNIIEDEVFTTALLMDN
jgi:hypothetical protein